MIKSQRTRLGIAIWLSAMVGVVIVSLTVIPQMLANAPHKAPVGIVVAASLLQSAVMVALAVWAGVGLSRALGLGAPVFEASLSGSGAWAALRPQLVPATIVGLLTAGLLVYLSHVAPAELLALGQTTDISLAAKLLYGGVTEEVLMRWGLMTVLIWLPWRFMQKRVGPPRLQYIVGGIFAAAVLFGAGHLPAAAAMGASLTPGVVTYIIVGNTVPALSFGYLFWRRGLEAAMLAHALAHLVSTLAGAA
ncbi:MAG: CPBP family glutamic-type intramembrane protease [Thermomonas sp.]